MSQYEEATEKYRVETEDLPEEIRPLVSKNGVDKVINYQGSYARFSVLLTKEGTSQEIRVFYLKNLREDWEWVEGTDDGVGFVLLKPRKE